VEALVGDPALGWSRDPGHWWDADVLGNSFSIITAALVHRSPSDNRQVDKLDFGDPDLVD